VELNKTLIIKGTPSQYVEAEDRRRVPPQSVSPRHQQLPQEGVDFIELWGVLVRNKWWILLAGVCTFAAVMTWTLRSPMEFAANGRLYLGELSLNHSAGRPETLDISGDSQGDLSSEMEILQSRSLVKRAILASGLNVDIRVAGQEPMRFYEWLRSDRDLGQLDAASQELVAVNSLLPEERREPMSFQVHFVNDASFEVTSDGAVLALGSLGQEVVADDVRLTLVPGELHRPQAGNVYDLTAHPIQSITDEVLKELLVNAPESKSTSPAKVVTLNYLHASPYAAKRFLSRLMECYLEERQTWKTEDASAAENFVTQQLDDMRRSLDDVEEKVSDFRTQNRVVSLEEEAQALVNHLGDYEEKRISARLEVAALNHIKAQLEKPRAEMEAFMVGEAVNEDSVLEGLAKSLAEAQVTLDELKFRFRENAPDVQDQRAQVNAHLQSIRRYVTNRLSRASDNLNNLNQVVGQYEAKLRSVPGAELRMSKLARESEVYSAMYSYLLQQQQQAAMVKASNVSKNRILDQPQVAAKESSPKLALRVASGPVGLILGSLLVLVGSCFNGKLQSVSDVKRVIGSVPVLARIPQRFKSGRRRKIAPLIDSKIKGLHFGFVEALRSLRTNLYYMDQNGNENGTVLLFTSPSPGDGKTTCTLALASMLAADGRKVLVVDADLRKPTHHTLLWNDDQKKAGKDDGESAEWEGAHPVSGSFGTFHSLRANDNSPSEVLSGSTMASFLSHMRGAYDYVLIDCAAYPLVSDALILAGQADICVSVFRLNKTKRQHALEHLEGLSVACASQAVIINDAASLGTYGSASYPSARVMDQLPLGRTAQDAQNKQENLPSSVRNMFI